MKSLLILFLFVSSTASAQYPIVAVRSVRLDDAVGGGFAEVSHPVTSPISDLVVIDPDGSERVIVEGGIDAIIDPKTIDGVNVFFVRIYDVENTWKRGGPPKSGSDIYSINLRTSEVTKWTDQAESPLAGFVDLEATPWVGGVFNTGPQPLPDGRLVFTSNRRRLHPTKNLTTHCLQLHVRHVDDSVECIGVMSQGSAMHPELLRDGRIAFSSYESMGLRDERLWSLWQIHPDGTNWGPLISSYGVTAFHFHTQRTSGEIVCAEYYNRNNAGFGTLIGIDEYPTYTDPSNLFQIHSGWFGGRPEYNNYAFAPSGMRSLTKWTHPRDKSSVNKANVPIDAGISSENTEGEWLGKVTHPSAAPDNAILVAYSNGPVNGLMRPTNSPGVHSEIRILRADDASGGPDDLARVIKRDGFSYTQPRALVSFAAIYGVEPIALPSKVDHSKSYGVFGSSDAFFGQWKFGLDSGATGQPESIIFLGTEPNITKISVRDLRGRQFSSGTTGWTNGINERLRILGEYSLDEPDRPEGDHSFRVKLPADVPFTVAIRGNDGRFLTCGQSWKQVRPGYQEINCMGCHNHAGPSVPNEGKYAWQDEYILPDFTGEWRIPEFNKDVKPIIDANCMVCHDGSQTSLMLDSAGVVKMARALRAGKSPLSHRIRGENGLDQMPLGGEPLSDADIRIIDEWIDCGCLVDDGSGSAFDVFDQVANPDPTPEAIPVGLPPIGPPPPPFPEDCELLKARIQVLESQIQRIKAIANETE